MSRRFRCQEGSDDLFEREILDVSNGWHEHNVGMHAPLETEPPVRGFIDNLESLPVYFANETEPVVEDVGQRHRERGVAGSCGTHLGPGDASTR